MICHHAADAARHDAAERCVLPPLSLPPFRHVIYIVFCAISRLFDAILAIFLCSLCLLYWWFHAAAPHWYAMIIRCSSTEYDACLPDFTPLFCRRHDWFFWRYYRSAMDMLKASERLLMMPLFSAELLLDMADMLYARERERAGLPPVYFAAATHHFFFFFFLMFTLLPFLLFDKFIYLLLYFTITIYAYVCSSSLEPL